MERRDGVLLARYLSGFQHGYMKNMSFRKFTANY